MAYLKNTIIDGELKVGSKSTLSAVDVQGDTTIASGKTIKFNTGGTTVIESNKITSTTFNGVNISKSGFIYTLSGSENDTKVDITGNAETATKLKTKIKIGGVVFDGVDDIDLPGVNTTGNQDTTGNAATATQLKTAIAISISASDSTNAGDGVTFDGSAPITLKLPSTIKAGTFIATSDKRLKENITPFKVEKSILDLSVYKYNFISDENKKVHVGCLAQDLQEICPEIVNEGQDGYLAIEESKIVYLLLEEVKKLRKEIDELKK